MNSRFLLIITIVIAHVQLSTLPVFCFVKQRITTNASIPCGKSLSGEQDKCPHSRRSQKALPTFSVMLKCGLHERVCREGPQIATQQQDLRSLTVGNIHWHAENLPPLFSSIANNSNSFFPRAQGDLSVLLHNLRI